MAISNQSVTTLAAAFGAGVTTEIVGVLNGTQGDTLYVGGDDGEYLFVNANGVVVNILGADAVDFRVKGDTNANLLFADASADAIGVGTSTPSDKALMEFSSTTRGVLLPRLTTTQRDAIASPPTGLLIYNTTTNKLNIRAASAWEAVTSS